MYAVKLDIAAEFGSKFNTLMGIGMSDQRLEICFSQTRLSGICDYAEMVFISLA